MAPFNEPSTIYWWAGNNQEGCHFDIATQNVIVQKLAAALQASGLAASGVGISASDETSIDSALLSLQGYTPPTLAAIEQINTHSVRSPACVIRAGACPCSTAARASGTSHRFACREASCDILATCPVTLHGCLRG